VVAGTLIKHSMYGAEDLDRCLVAKVMGMGIVVFAFVYFGSLADKFNLLEFPLLLLGLFEQASWTSSFI
jgi:hypothetical protein